VPAHNSVAVPRIVLIRHGETDWSKAGRHTSYTDRPLTAVGRTQARAAGRVIRALLDGRRPSHIVSSPRQRARQTARLAGFEPDAITERAAEWNYGDLEGKTTAEIQQPNRDWSIWSGPVPGGEDADQISTRLDALLDELRPLADAGPVLVFTHGHAGRCLAARWLAEPVSAGRHYFLSTGSVSALGFEHARPVLLNWNLDPALYSNQGGTDDPGQ